MLGPIQKAAELGGIGLILALLALYVVYGEQRNIPKHFIYPILLIIASSCTSMFMANLSRDQALGATIYAQRAVFYYLLYFLLHQLKIRPKDLEILFISFGILYVILYFIQYFLYPTKIFDTYVRFDRGTIRIYMAGSAYLAAAFLIFVQLFLRTNRVKFLLLILLFFSVFILTGGRQTLAIMSLVFLLFLIFDKKVKSKLLLFILGLVGSLLVYIIFQDIFSALFIRSQKDLSQGGDYIRIQASYFFLTDFYKSGIAYLTGNGVHAPGTSYAMEIQRYQVNYGYYLSDIGLIGNFVQYGMLFLLGVVIIFYRAFRIKIQNKFAYVRYIFVVILLSILTGGAFGQAHFICYITCVFYIIDVSQYEIKQSETFIN